MKIKQTIRTRITLWLLHFLQIQLFLNAISLPILINWGLPISVLSPIGNLIFFPALISFLFISATIFFLEICCIPNGWFIYLLEKITSWWLSAMSVGDGNRWLVGLKKPSLLFVLIIPIFAVAIIQNRKTNSLKRSILFLLLLLVGAFGYLKIINRSETFINHIECNNAYITLIKTANSQILIDPGIIGKRISAPSWVEYNLSPSIIQTIGSNYLDTLIILQPSIMTFKAAEKLCATLKIDTIYLPYWTGNLDKNGWKSFFHFKKTIDKHHIKLTRIGNKQTKINLSGQDFLSIEPLSESINYQNAKYPAMHIYGQIDNKPVTIYSAKYDTKKS